MARMRYIKPEFWTDGKMVALSFAARLLYIGMWNFAVCDKGHVEDDVLRLKMQVFPADDVDVQSALDELVGSGRVVRVELSTGETFLHVIHLGDHQKVDPRWTPRCAACKDAIPAETPATSTEPAKPHRNSPKLSDTLPKTPQEGIGEERRVKNTRAPAPPAMFEEFWAAYPKRVDKGHARTAYTKALAKTDSQTLVTGAQRYAAAQAGGDPKFTALPTTWLNGERWEDEAVVVPLAPARERSPWDRPFVGETR